MSIRKLVLNYASFSRSHPLYKMRPYSR